MRRAVDGSAARVLGAALNRTRRTASQAARLVEVRRLLEAALHLLRREEGQ